jgi:serine/threonine protein kinase
VDELEILEIIGEIATGLLHLHLQNPPIAHRDLKVNMKRISKRFSLRMFLKEVMEDGN